MAEPRLLIDGIWTSGQIRPDEVATLAGRFATIVNNRPDGEEAGQPASSEIEGAAHGAGLDYAFIPVTPGRLTDTEVLAARQVLADASRPVLLFCRTGNRSAMLWAMTQAGTRSTPEILKIAADAGYDLTALAPRLGEAATPA